MTKAGGKDASLSERAPREPVNPVSPQYSAQDEHRCRRGMRQAYIRGLPLRFVAVSGRAANFMPGIR
eukprot:40395-Eustigmatos_ZCMA.PRE.1